MIEYKDFEKVEMRVGKIIKVDDFPEAKKPSYKLEIDFGDFGIKRSSAQITKLYQKQELIGKNVVAVTNFKPKQIANFISEVLILGVNDENNNVVLLTTEREAKIGERVY
ncbi:MAG: tRNA-binding protein [Candidatus Aenigmatarchaeota archaeon]|nr:tRNA-binding protein [Candidatus Aenigmarchaeota archaeon]